MILITIADVAQSEKSSAGIVFSLIPNAQNAAKSYYYMNSQLQRKPTPIRQPEVDWDFKSIGIIPIYIEISLFDN